MSDPDTKANLTILLYLPFTLAWSGLVASMLWSWFIVPIGAHPIGVAQAVGVKLLFFVIRGQPTKSTTTGSSLSIALLDASYTAIVFALGWIAHYTMTH